MVFHSFIGLSFIAYCMKQDNKIIIMANPQYINNLLNKSVSKQTYSFSRSQRFKTEGNRDNYCFYDIPSLKSKRATGMGYGKKYFMEQTSVSPPPGTYQTKSLFSKTTRHGKTFGLGREEIIFNSPLGDLKKAKNTIGPNHYHLKLKSYSRKGGLIGNKLPSQFDQLKKKNVPGPGTYNFVGADMNKSGSYFLSIHRNNISPRYYNHSAQKKSLKSSLKISLGPGQYNTNDQFGRSVLSKFKNSVNNSFMKTKRPGLQDKSKRGFPSSHYRSFSEFGMNI